MRHTTCTLGKSRVETAMSAIHAVASDHKMVWRGGDFTKEDIAFNLTARHAAALEDVLGRIRSKELADILPADCRHPALDADLEKVFDEIQEGRGIVIVRGIPVANHPVDDVGDETPPGGEESARGYTSRRELSLHTDLGQIVGLMCVRQARAGGQSQYASGLAIFN